MQPVEVPDYTGFFAAVSIVLAVATVVCALTKTKANNRIMSFLKSLSLYFSKSVHQGSSARHKNDLARMYGAQKNKASLSKRLSMWNLRPHLKEDYHLCGFIKPGEWQCNCGKAKCEIFGNLCEAVGGIDATPPVHPVPNRRAAIAHSRNK